MSPNHMEQSWLVWYPLPFPSWRWQRVVTRNTKSAFKVVPGSTMLAQDPA